MRFSPDGTALASGSFDRTLLLWRVYDECENYMMLRGHKNAVLQVHWLPSGDGLVSCSADRSVRAWDAEAGVQVKRFSEHRGIVNSCAPLPRGPPLLASGGDDSAVKVRCFAPGIDRPLSGRPRQQQQQQCCLCRPPPPLGP